jgi:hypothetical protein
MLEIFQHLAMSFFLCLLFAQRVVFFVQLQCLLSESLLVSVALRDFGFVRA